MDVPFQDGGCSHQLPLKLGTQSIHLRDKQADPQLQQKVEGKEQ